MESMGLWDIFLLCTAGFIAVTSLVRLMRRQRSIVLTQLQAEVEAEQQRQAAEKEAKLKTEKRPAGTRSKAA